MASARELLEQADALMRRNRAGVIDTEIPELREVISMVALAPAPDPVPTVLDDIPELTEAVEEIEISSIVELPDDIDESSGWMHHDHGELKVVTTGPDSMLGRPPEWSEGAVATPAVTPVFLRSALAVVADAGATRGSPAEPPPAAAAEAPTAAPVEAPTVAPVEALTVASVETPTVASVEAPAAAPAEALPVASAEAPTVAPVPPAIPDEWARWEVLADEIRMQVLQRIDLFTEARLKDELSAELKPIVDRASAEMVATINERVGGLIRAYIAEAIEREIQKWRGAAS